MTADQIRAAILWITAVMRGLVYEDPTADEADLSLRSMSDDEDTRYSEGRAELTRLNALLAQHDEMERLAENPAAHQRPDTTGAPSVNRNDDPFDLSDLRFTATADELRGRALTAIETMRALPQPVSEQLTEMVERHGGELIGRVLATGSDAYRSAAAKLMGGKPHMLTDAERVAVERAQSLTDSEGGYAVPVHLDPTIMLTNAGSESALRQVARTATIVGKAWNGVTSAGATAHYHGEATEMEDDSIDLGPEQVPVHRMDIFVPFSFEIEGDWASFDSDIREVMNDAKTQKENEKFAIGSGVGEPTGFVTALAGTSSIVTPTTPETFAVADIYKVEEALGDRFIDDASWLANRAIYNDVRQFGNNADGATLWERLGAATPPELIGYPARRVSHMASGFNAAATANNYVLAFGSWKRGFLIVDRVGMNFELVPHLFATANNRPSGQRAILAWCRNGSDVIVKEALRLLNIATAA